MKHSFFFLSALMVFLISPLFFNMSTVSAQVKIMPIGDSITDLDGSYRCPLYDKLRANGYSVRSVGTERDPFPRSGCSNGGNISHFGYSGVTLQGVRDLVRNNINNVEVADFALIHLATNNYWPRSGNPYTATEHQNNLTAMKDLISIIRTRSTNTRVLVAQLIGTQDQTMNGYIFTFNFSYLNTLAGQSGVYLVDQYNGFNPTKGADTYDGVHPSEGTGNVKMADKWLATILPLLKSQPIPSSIPQPTATPVRTTAPTPVSTPVVTTAPTRRPYGGVPVTVPGVIEAENYDEGGSNVGYFDKSSGNNGNVYRNDNVDLESNRVGGTSVGWIETGEWLHYTFRVGTSGSYSVHARVASASEDGRFDFTIDDRLGGSFNVANSGGWFNWYTVQSGAFTLSAGDHTLKVTAAAGNVSAVANLDSLSIQSVSGSPSTPVPTPMPTQNPRFDLNKDGTVNASDVLYMFTRWSL